MNRLTDSWVKNLKCKFEVDKQFRVLRVLNLREWVGIGRFYVYIQDSAQSCGVTGVQPHFERRLYGSGLVGLQWSLVIPYSEEKYTSSGGATPGHARSKNLVKKQMTWP